MPETLNTLVQEFIVSADDNGFVPLKAFAQKTLKRSANDISTFFDLESRFYSRYQQTIIHNIKHNVVFIKRYKKDGSLRARVCEGGVHQDDLLTFITRAKNEIEENEKRFDAAYKNYYGLE